MNITKLHYNWLYDRGEFEVAEVGKNGVVKISGNKECYFIDYENGNVEYIYNPNKAFLVNEEKNKQQ